MVAVLTGRHSSCWTGHGIGWAGGFRHGARHQLQPCQHHQPWQIPVAALSAPAMEGYQHPAYQLCTVPTSVHMAHQGQPRPNAPVSTADISAHSPLRTTPAKRPCLYRRRWHWHHHHLRTILLTNMLPWWMVPLPLMASLLRGAQHYSFPHLRCTGIMRGNLCSMSASLHQPAVPCMHKQDTACMSRVLHAFTSTWPDGWPAGRLAGSGWVLTGILQRHLMVDPPHPPVML